VKLLFCIKGLNNPGGGAERVLVEIASGLARRGHQVAVLTFDSPGGESFYLLDAGIERIELGLGPTTKPSNPSITVRRMFALRSAVQEYAPDAVIAFMHSMFVPLSLALVGLHVPLVASEHTNYQHYSHRHLQALLLSLVPGLADVMTCVSEGVRQTYPAFLSKRMIIIPNPVTLEISACADVLAHARQRKILLSIGRLDAGKDHATLINAFAKLAARVPDWDLRIAGEGPLRRRLEEQIAALGLNDRVGLPGAIREIAKEYQNAQLLVMPSRYESFSLTTVEALAHRLPVIAFCNCTAIAEWIEPKKNGVLVDPAGDRAEALAASLLPLMTDAELRRQLAGGSKRLKEYCLDDVLDQWQHTLRSLDRHGAAQCAR
jgi:glycosyltransferase involved in cell wall biosynthesis